MVAVAAAGTSANLLVERANQLSLGFAMMDLFWNHERVGEVRVGKIVEIKLIPGEGDFQVGMRSPFTRKMFFTKPLRLKLVGDKTTFIRVKADPNVFGWPSINFWVDKSPVPQKICWAWLSLGQVRPAARHWPSELEISAIASFGRHRFARDRGPIGLFCLRLALGKQRLHPFRRWSFAAPQLAIGTFVLWRLRAALARSLPPRAAAVCLMTLLQRPEHHLW